MPAFLVFFPVGIAPAQTDDRITVSGEVSGSQKACIAMVAVKDNPYGVKGKAGEIGGNSILQRLPVGPHSAWDVFLLVAIPASQVKKQNVILFQVLL